jgi:hypothetical protein
MNGVLAMDDGSQTAGDFPVNVTFSIASILSTVTFLLTYCSERKFCSGSKLKEMSGSGIFAEKSENGDSEASNHANKTSVRMYQVLILFKYFLPNFFSAYWYCCIVVIYPNSYYMCMWTEC